MSSEFRINEAYAERYNKWRQKEELQKLKDKYGNIDEIDSSSSESEDEDAEALTAQVEKDWLRTLAALKRDDPKIYEKDTVFYHSEDEDEEDRKKKSNKKQKAVYLKDYERKVILEKDGQISSESEDDDDAVHISDKPGYYEEQEEIKKSFQLFMSDSEDSSDSELFSKKEKTSKEQEEEEEEYLEWLKGQKDELESTEKKVGIELEPLKEYWNNPTLETDEKFLRDYILNKGYIDKDSNRIPSYEEIVLEQEGISDEEELLEKQETFERKYNFRFEEPDQEFIKSYPRTIKDSVRMKDNKRSEKRQEVKDRKAMEKEKKKEEIKQLKNLKKQEILDKIEKLKEITGNKSLGFSTEDIDDDFDPKKHDDMMQKYFDEEYYGQEAEDQKPEFSDDEDLEVENWDTWKGGHEEEAGYDEAGGSQDDDLYCDDPNFIMDADYDPSQAVKRKKKNKKSKFSQALTKSKPVFDPKEKSFEQYFEEYYKLDCEDIIDDLPCRFKYRKVTPNDYGLSVDEVLNCKDKELNQWVSLKKMSQYRTKEEENTDVKIYTQKAKNPKKKANILTSLRDKEEEQVEIKQQQREKKAEAKRKKRQRKKQRSAEIAAGSSQSETAGKYELEMDTEPAEKKMKTDISAVKGNELPEINAKPFKSDKKVKTKQTSSNGEKSFDSGSGFKELNSKDNNNSPKKKKIKEEGKGDVKYQTEENTPKQGITTCAEDTTVSNKESSNFVSKNKLKKLKKKKRAVEGNVIEKDNNLQKVAKKKKRREGAKPILTDERLLAYGIKPKKFKFMKLKKIGGEQS